MHDFKFTDSQEVWLAALESGEHKQCFGALEEAGGVCPLGLALRLEGSQYADLLTITSQLHMTPASERHVIRLNDVNRLSLPEIAARIRREPTRFFTRGAA